MITVVELPEFIRKSKKLLNEEDRNDIINYLAYQPDSGVIIKGTGGIRKLRWKKQGTGKSGGVRVIYYYKDLNLPIFLLTVFAKSDKTDLSMAQRNELAKLVKILVENHSGSL